MKLKKLFCCIATVFCVISNAACASFTQGDKMKFGKNQHFQDKWI